MTTKWHYDTGSDEKKCKEILKKDKFQLKILEGKTKRKKKMEFLEMFNGDKTRCLFL